MISSTTLSSSSPSPSAAIIINLHPLTGFNLIPIAFFLEGIDTVGQDKKSLLPYSNSLSLCRLTYEPKPKFHRLHTATLRPNEARIYCLAFHFSL